MGGGGEGSLPGRCTYHLGGAGVTVGKGNENCCAQFVRLARTLLQHMTNTL